MYGFNLIYNFELAKLFYKGQDSVNHRKSQSDMIEKSRQYALIILVGEMDYNFLMLDGASCNNYHYLL